MGKILGSWSGMRKYLEQEMLADSLKGRIRYGCTAYTGMDDCHIFDICIDGKQVKRFSLETANTYFIESGFSSKDHPMDSREYWDGFWQLLSAHPIENRTEYTDEEFCAALEEYRNQNILKSIDSTDPIVRMFAILDRRLGKRTLARVRKSVSDQSRWLQQFYLLRLQAERI